jgi:hypothetical protein
VASSGGSVGLASPCCASGGVGWFVGLYFMDMSEVWMLWYFINGGEGLGWLIEWSMIGGFLRWSFGRVQTVAESPWWHRQGYF